MEKRLQELLEKDILTLEEYEEIEEAEEVEETEDCGMSGREIGCHLYSVITTDGEEHEVLVK